MKLTVQRQCDGTEEPNHPCDARLEIHVDHPGDARSPHLTRLVESWEKAAALQGWRRIGPRGQDVVVTTREDYGLNVVPSAKTWVVCGDHAEARGVLCRDCQGKIGKCACPTGPIFDAIDP